MLIPKPHTDDSDISYLLSTFSNEDFCNQDGKKFDFYGSRMFVTYSKSSFTEDRIEEFHQRLKLRMPANTEIYGCFELHEDGSPHYHVLISFSKRTHWNDARKKLRIGTDDTAAIRIVKPRKNQMPVHFIDGVQGYIEKTLPDGSDKPLSWIFGTKQRLETSQAKAKRKWAEIDQEQDYDTCKRMIRQEDGRVFFTSYNNISNCLRSEKIRRYKPKAPPRYEVKPWILPDLLLEWKRVNIDEDRSGRKSSLLLIGASKTGKTRWATSFGRPMVMSSKWNMKNYIVDATHLVVNDCHVDKFGFGGDSYWREVFGCQEEFDASDKFMENRRLDWDIPCIWTCNEDLNPMKVEAVANYIVMSGCTVYDVGINSLF